MAARLLKIGCSTTMATMRSSAIRKLAEAATAPLLATGFTFLALDVARRVFRHTQLFCPERQPVKTWDPQDYGIPRDRTTEHWIETPDGELLYAWYARAKNPIASAVFCHGNTGNLTTSADVIPHLLDSGISMLLFDYRGFGKSSGRPSLDGVVLDGCTAARFHDLIRPKHIPTILYGFSLGGAVAAQVIQRHPFDGLILQSTFTNLPQLARAVFPRLPLHLVAGNVFDTLSVIRRLTVPLLVLHGGADEVAPCWMAHTLYEHCPSVKQIQVIDGGLHKDLFVRDSNTLIWAVNRFAAALPRNTQQVVEQPRPSRVDEFIESAIKLLRRAPRRHHRPAHQAP